MATKEELTERRKEAIKRRMERTRARLATRLHTLGETIHGVRERVESVQSTVESVQETVKSTVESVQDTVKSTVETARDALDVSKHPLAWLGGSVVAGYLCGVWWHSQKQAPVPPTYPTGFLSPGPSPPPAVPPAEASRPEESTGFLGGLFGEWFDRLKGLGIGAGVGLLRDLVATEVPPNLRSEVMEMGNNAIKDLGGQVLDPMLIDPAILKGEQKPEQEEERDHGPPQRPEPPGRAEETQRVPGSTRRQGQAVSAVPY